MKFLQNISLRSKLLIASLIPIITLLYYLQLSLRHELANKQAVESIILDVSVVQDISMVIHEFQKERALTLIFLSTGGRVGREQVVSQRPATDQAVSELRKTLKVQKRHMGTSLY